MLSCLAREFLGLDTVGSSEDPQVGQNSPVVSILRAGVSGGVDASP